MLCWISQGRDENSEGFASNGGALEIGEKNASSTEEQEATTYD